MLGRLLHLGSSGSSVPTTQATAKMSKPISSLESVQEDIHTRNLLFPDAQALYQHRNDQVFPLSSTPATPATSTANAFDFSGDVDLDVRDVRIVIMQDALGPSNASLLFDSHPAAPLPPNERQSPSQDSRRGPTSARKASLGQSSRPLVIQADGPPTQPRQGAFDRRASLHGRSSSTVETDLQRAAREYREELATISGCIFGNSELMAYKGTSTKVHVVPSDSRPPDMSSIVGDGRSSIGRSSARSSKLSQSYSSQTISPTNPPPLNANYPPRPSEKKKVLITRLFPVNLTSEEGESNTSPPSQYTDENAGFPFPATGDEPFPKAKRPQPKQRRTPMYAVVLVVQLPPVPPLASTRVSQTVQSKSAHRESSSYTDQELFSSSYSSTRPSAWTMVGSSMYGDTGDTAYSIDMEDRIDSLTQHWDIIMRTLTHLQSVVAVILATMLKQVDLVSPGPVGVSTASQPTGRLSFSERRSGDLPRIKPPKSTTKLVSLLPNSLAEDKTIAGEVDAARHRIVMGLSAARVVTGQGRWGIWREEARWASRWAGDERNAFLNNLLTGFLANHTDWIQALCPPSYRRRVCLLQKNRGEEDLSLPARTVIVADDKMAARRLVFLLSAFLPANQQIPASRAHRASTSTSIGTFSNSPPTFIVPVLREESLRRKINRRTGGARRASHSRTASQSARSSAAIPLQLAHLSMDRGHERRVSDAASIRQSNLPMTGNDLVSRKSSAATTTTVMPETTMPHFSTGQRMDNPRRPRPSSSGSVAADDLKRSLHRGESTGHASNASSDSRSQSSRWGSVISGLWSTRRRDSTAMSTYSPSDNRSPSKPTQYSRPDKLSQMVQEVSQVEEGLASSSRGPRPPTDAPDVMGREFGRDSREPSIRPDRTPDPNGAFESPVKTSINADDGVIDVDISFPEYMTSFESAISSPSSSGYLSTPGIQGGFDSFEQASRMCVDGDLPLNAAGWLNRYHPDFALQAIPPQEDLVEQIKASLRAEPTPLSAFPLGGDQGQRWVDVSNVLIADCTVGTVTRIRYRRLVKPRSPLDRPTHPTGGYSGSYGAAILTPSVVPYEIQLEDDWIVETVEQPDSTVIEAVEKVVSLTHEPSKESTLSSSQPRDEVHMSTDGGDPNSITAPQTPALPPAPVEVPRAQCKAVVLSALEDVIRDVVEAREKSVHHGRAGQSPDTMLHEAIHVWFDNLDTADG